MLNHQAFYCIITSASACGLRFLWIPTKTLQVQFLTAKNKQTKNNNNKKQTKTAIPSLGVEQSASVNLWQQWMEWKLNKGNVQFKCSYLKLYSRLFDCVLKWLCSVHYNNRLCVNHKLIALVETFSYHGCFVVVFCFVLKLNIYVLTHNKP